MTAVLETDSRLRCFDSHAISPTLCCIQCTREPWIIDLRQVVVGVTDPNPLVGGAGIKTLQDAGISVTSGVEEVAVSNDVGPDLIVNMNHVLGQR